MAIKSFQGVRSSVNNDNKNILVRDIMKRNLIVFSPNDSIFDVMKKFVKNKISGGPVLNKSGKIVGVISEADCMKEISDSRYFNMPILDKRVNDGFGVKFYGNVMCLTYQSDVRLKEVYASGFESDIESQLAEIVKFLQKEYKKITKSNVTLSR